MGRRGRCGGRLLLPASREHGLCVRGACSLRESLPGGAPSRRSAGNDGAPRNLRVGGPHGGPMNRLALALLAFVDLLGCKAQVIDALEGTGGMDSSSPEAAAIDAQPEGAPAAEALAYYSFDEGMGTVVHDGSGNGHNGTLVGGAWTDAGRFGSAIR